MLSLILKFIKNAWNKWNITGFVLLGLVLQTFLLFTASLRKKTASKWVIWPIWSVYLLADWAASFAVGLILDYEKRYTSGPMDDNGLLLVLWTPFLLLFVGGQDRISSFAIEDNEFWLRHLIWLILQVFTTGYVFIRSLSKNRLWIPTLLLFLAAIIRYAERTSAMYLASSDSLGISVLREPDPGADYEKLMNAYSSSKNNNLPTYIVSVPHKESRDLENNTFKEGDLENQELVQYAYHFSNIYKALIVNLMFTSREHKESREFFSKRNAEETLRVLEIELNFFYDVLHTKVVVTHSKLGKISWYISLGLVVAALSLFLKEEKKDFKSSDVRVTYTLFFGALGLDMVNLLTWTFSDWTFASLESSKKDYCLANILSKFLINKVIGLKMSRWKGGRESEKPVWATTFIFKRWSASLSQFNFIDYCLKKSPKRMNEAHMMTNIGDKISTFFRYIGDKIFTYLCIKDYLDQKINDMILTRYVSHKPLPKKLWDLIFTELRQKSEFADDPEMAKEISSARGEWALACVDINIDCSRLMPYVNDVAYDESLLLWHIATELCYNKEMDKNDDENDGHRALSRYLSHYMLYLLYQLPGMMSEVPGIAKLRFKDTCAEAKRFFSKRKPEDIKNKMEPGDLKLACLQILAVNTDVKPVDVKGDRSKSVLFDACILAKEIEKLGEKKWMVMTKVWVELLSYAASRSRANAHVQRLSQGGELLTFVWLLMAHFGLREHALVKTRARKLMIGK
ncbi:hypothetical protein RGQ29_016448 [Quercus rubra]|uniref:DUF4220 domain-containing protein n=1 Tax=Quercus rubra TaxID=3512 RepID=A0AAN7FEX2_QUERU|nr:hypothetical protein RGQ29_016448 [Quercus rubra]